MPEIPAPSQTTATAGKKLSLSNEDVARLLSERGTGARLDVVQRIASNYNSGSFSDRESMISEQIFRHMAQDTEVKIRAALSEMLKENGGIPRDIALKFAQDEEASVALPMLSRSTALSEYDLVSIVEKYSADPNRLIVIAQRPIVSERLSGALIDTRQESAVTALTNNPDAKISEKSYHTIIETFQAQSGLMAQLAKREGLPVTIAEQLISQVSGQLTEQWRDQYRLYESDVLEQTESVRENATLQLLDEDNSDAAHAALVNQMLAGNKLTPSLLLSSLCRGNVLFFEMALARLANIPLHNAQLLIHDTGGLGFSRLYAKAELPKTLFEATKLTLSVVKPLEDDGEIPGTRAFADRAVSEILSRAGQTKIDNLAYILSLIRHHGKAA